MPVTHSLEQCLGQEYGNERHVLSIQSHVVSGFVGNKCAVFPLQLLGFEVDTVNSVQFSNHTQYSGGFSGQRLNAQDLAELFDGLRKNGLHANYSHILTGYCGDPTFLRQIVDIVHECRLQRPDLVYICDPVMGDHGKYYHGMPAELMAIYRDEVLPLADVITPNAFELSELSGLPVQDEAQCLRAIAHLHRTRRVRTIVMTSGLITGGAAQNSPNTLYCYASELLPAGEGGVPADATTDDELPLRQFRFEIPLVQGSFYGAGDLFAALLLAWLQETGGQLCAAVRATISSLQAVLVRTSKHAFARSSEPSCGDRELRLMQSRLDLLQPRADQVKFAQLAGPGKNE